MTAVSSEDNSQLAVLLRTRRHWGPLLNALIRNTGMGIYAVDADGHYVLFNPECERLTGFTERRLLSAAPMNPNSPVPEGFDVVALLRPERRMFEADAGTAVKQLHITKADGSRRWVEVTLVPVGGAGGRVEVVVGFLRDIHEQKLLQSHMARLEKLAALGELTASIAHEVRNPLAAMKLGLQALAEEVAENNSAVEITHEISAEVNRLDRVVGRLLDFARVKESEFQETDLAVLADRTLNYVRNQAKARNILVRVLPSEDLRPVRCDPDQIQQILLNVILNSFHAMKGGGELIIVLDRCECCRLPSGEPGPAARIRLSDNGVGIPAEVLHKVFDPFFSTRPGGTGLGLSVSFQMISRHGGDIDIESEVGKGTTVTILLPESGPTGRGRCETPSGTHAAFPAGSGIRAAEPE
mgnify:CR=1 FL=1